MHRFLSIDQTLENIHEFCSSELKLNFNFNTNQPSLGYGYQTKKNGNAYVLRRNEKKTKGTHNEKSTWTVEKSDVVAVLHISQYSHGSATNYGIPNVSSL